MTRLRWRDAKHALPGLALALAFAAPAHAQSFVNFESGQVRPLALSPDGTRLFAVNTPDNRLEVFAVGAGLTHVASVPVGLEPVAVAARNDSEVWVVNHLSDSVSIVDVGSTPPRVTRTLLVGDEPRDVVFAGPGRNRAFVTAAHRGQNGGFDPQLTAEGIGRADVWVWDANNLGATLGGTPLTRVVLFGDTPRALAASPDGSTVYAAVFHSGNQTTALSEGVVCNGGALAPPCNVGGFTMPGGLPAPNMDADGVTGPETGLIVKFDTLSGQWRDELGRNWNNGVRFSLPDLDVFRIDANANPPAQTASFAHVGTILFDLAVNPVNGQVYVSNTDARNEVRFEGPGDFFGNTSVRGRLHESRITVIDGASTFPRHLNKHIDYDQVPSPAGTREKSLATPLGMAVTADGTTLYVAAFGSSKIGVFSTAELRNDSFVPDAADQITVSGGGPTGLVLDEANDRLYAFTRFDNSVSVIDLNTRQEIAHVAVFSPEPAEIVLGRPLLYDAFFTSSNGEASCSSCHVFGDFDSLAWDLGNPDDSVLNNPNPLRLVLGDPDFHPLKGPMTTQSLRGMAGHGPMHWRGDRTGGNDPGGNALDEDAAFKKFNPAFVGLLGRATELSAQDMQDFTDFVLTVTYPPNPIRALDNSLTTAQQAARNLYFGRATDGFANCNGCHVLDRAAGFFGSDGFTTFENEPQHFKVAHLRNMYQKVGMFGMPQVSFFTPGNNGPTGDQVRGFGFLHDGSTDTLARFHSATVFDTTVTEEAQMEQFMLAFDTDLFPIAGQQITLTSANGAVAGPRINLLLARDDAGECEVVVKGNVAGQQRGSVRNAAGQFRSDRTSEPLLTDAQVRGLAATPGQELTYTCVPPGSGTRIGVDRDEDGFFDRDEIDAGSDPANPDSFPGGPTPTPTPVPTATPVVTATPAVTPTPTATPAVTLVPTTAVRSTVLSLRDDPSGQGIPERLRFRFRSIPTRNFPSGVVQPPWGGPGDPTLFNTSLVIYRAGSNQKVVLPLPMANWQRTGTADDPGYAYRDPGRGSGPISTVTLRKGRLTVIGKGAGLYELDGAPQGTMAVRLSLGGLTPFCGSAPAKAPASSNDTTARFIGAPNSPAGPCPVFF